MHLLSFVKGTAYFLSKLSTRVKPNAFFRPYSSAAYSFSKLIKLSTRVNLNAFIRPYLSDSRFPFYVDISI